MGGGGLGGAIFFLGSTGLGGAVLLLEYKKSEGYQFNLPHYTVKKEAPSSFIGKKVFLGILVYQPAWMTENKRIKVERANCQQENKLMATGTVLNDSVADDWCINMKDCALGQLRNKESISKLP